VSFLAKESTVGASMFFTFQSMDEKLAVRFWPKQVFESNKKMMNNRNIAREDTSTNFNKKHQALESDAYL
jgi:hypothetical protein